MVLVYLYEAIRNLLAPIAAHALFNAANFFFLLFGDEISRTIPPAMNELDFIARLTRSLPANATVVAGAGDDCAVLDCGRPGHSLLFKTDAVVEGIHFTAQARPEQIGHKALGRCLSDIAAMAGRPLAALITARAAGKL